MQTSCQSATMSNSYLLQQSRRQMRIFWTAKSVFSVKCKIFWSRIEFSSRVRYRWTAKSIFKSYLNKRVGHIKCNKNSNCFLVVQKSSEDQNFHSSKSFIVEKAILVLFSVLQIRTFAKRICPRMWFLSSK